MTRPRSIQVSAVLAVLAVGLAIGCSSRAPDEAAPAVPGAPAAMPQPGALLAASAGERVAVAEVNGVPIHGDCVATQSEALGVTRELALRQCIDFELLAQAAQRRGKAGDSDAIRAGKTEAVRRLLDVEVKESVPAADGAAGEGDRALLEAAYKRYRERIYRPEIRQVAHVLAHVPEDAAEGSAEDLAARALAGDIHAALAGRRDLSADDFFALARDVAGDRPLGPIDDKTGELRPERFKLYPGIRSVHEAFTGAAFAVVEVGAVSPPTRTHVGWHVILVDAIEPAQNTTVDHAADTLISLLHRERYLGLINALQKKARIEVNEHALSELQAAEDALRFAPSESP